MNLIKKNTITNVLKKGDEVLAISVSSPVNDQRNLVEGLDILHEWGLTCRNLVKPGKYWGYFSGEDSTRYNDLHPKEITSLIAFARGGWGAARLLERPQQPWKPGWMMGFSDISSLLLARLSAGFDGSIHGPLLCSLSKEPEWSKDRLKSLLFKKSIPDLYGEPWVQGIGKGTLVATNLTVATHLLGSSYLPNLKGAILVLEDTGEAPYRIDRMLTQWRLNGLLQNLAGLAFGNFTFQEEKEEEEERQKFSLKEILKERSFDLNIPVVANLPVGHCCGNAALPLGWTATLDGYTGRLSVSPS